MSQTLVSIWIPPLGVGRGTLATRVRLVLSRLFFFLLFVWASTVGFGWSGPCSSLVLFMVLRPLCWLPVAYESCAPPYPEMSGLVDSLWPRLGLCSTCWKVLRGAYCVVWFRFWMLRRYLAYRPSEVGRVCRLLDMVSHCYPGHVPINLLASGAADIGFRWNSQTLSWARPGLLPVLRNIAGLFQHFRSAIHCAWRDAVAADLCAWSGFRGGPSFWMCLAR